LEKYYHHDLLHFFIMWYGGRKEEWNGGMVEWWNDGIME
jgi:hypothetical protein